MSVDYNIRKLQEEIDGYSSSQDSKKPLIIAIGTPIIIFLLLIIFKPSIVTKKSGNKYVRCGKKIFQWTLIFTVIIWILIYLYMYYITKDL